MSTSPKQGDPKNPDKDQSPRTVSVKQLFRYATKLDLFLMIVGTLTSLCTGAIFPAFSLLLGAFTTDISPGDMLASYADSASTTGVRFVLVGLGALAIQMITYWCWIVTGARQTRRYREEYFKAMLRQPISFFDASNPNEFASKIASEIELIAHGLGEKVSEISYCLSTVLSGFLLGYIKGWELSTVMLANIPVAAIAAGIFARALQKQSKKSLEVYAQSGGSAEQALGAMRTVASLTGEPKELNNYQKGAKMIKRIMILFAAQTGFSIGLFTFAKQVPYALGFWFGSKLISWERINAITGQPWSVGDVLTVFFTMTISLATLGFLAPSIKAFAEARFAAANVIQIIDKKVEYSAQDKKGITKAQLDGEIVFKGVDFSYPVRSEIKVLNNMILKILKNKKNALVGESGCGKSTCMQLIERFYDVDAGAIEIDGKNIKNYNIGWLRSQIGYVGQEPVLFSTSIRENLQLAKPGASDEEIWAALAKANAAEFVQGFKDKLDTFVGNSGAALSGGQKQRLAIARIILKNPSILLLDEATSALDRKNELEIQDTLDEVAKGRTSIVIAHRLTTIQNADQIFLIDKGAVVEQGTHNELIEKRGRYYELQKDQIAAPNQQAFHKEEEPHSLKMKPVSSKDNELIKRNGSEIVTNNKDTIVISIKETEEPKTPNESKGMKNEQEATKEDPFSSMSFREKKTLQQSLTRRLFQLNKPERKWYLLGVLFALLYGAINPIFGMIFSRILQVLSDPKAPDFRQKADLYSLIFFILALVSIFTMGLKETFMGIAGEGLTERVRALAFDKMTRMHIGWFDSPKNLPGILSTRLAVDAQAVNTLTTSAQSMAYQAFSAITTGLVISFLGSWQVGLIALGAIPIFLGVALFTIRGAKKLSAKNTEIQKEAGQYLSESLCNIRTVMGLNCEDYFLNMYVKYADKTKKLGTNNGVKLAVSAGFIQFSFFGFFALLFYSGAMFISHGWISFVDLFQAVFGILFAAIELVHLGKSATDIGKGYGAAASLFRIIDEKSLIDYKAPIGRRDTSPILGNIEFRNVKFKYPTRDRQIFDGLTFKVNVKSKIALVGPSGCGKSTIMQLLLRFYDIQEGEILVDGKNIQDYDIHHLRRSFGLVAQEPFLFNGTVEENIK